MRIITLNVNGLRAALRKGLLAWLERQQADFVCLQEIRAYPAQLRLAARRPCGYQAFYYPAQRPGYSGVAIWSRERPDRVREGLGWPEADQEGRCLVLDIGKLSVASLYLPSGSASPERQVAKFAFMRRLLPLLARWRRERRRYVICGDWNIAHREIDLRNWCANRKHSGFLPEERAWLDSLFNDLGWVDAFRVLNQAEGQYTWWSNRGKAWQNNVGWRIDYQVISPVLRAAVRSVSIYKGQRFSDHAPLLVEYAL